MRRRDFLKATAATGLISSLPAWAQSIAAAPQVSNIVPSLDRRILVFIHLPGGPDFRHLLPPPFTGDENSYGYQHWQARAGSHALDENDPTAWEQRWLNDYGVYHSGNQSFGILNQAGWLQTMWDAGNVAIVNNVIGGTSRNHRHCQLILDQGNIESTSTDIERSGWGGRLAQFGNSNVVSLTNTPRNFCFGALSSNPEGRTDNPLISIPNSRNIALFHPQPGDELTVKGKLARSLKSYYAAKRNETAVTSHYKQFIDHEEKARQFGNQISAALASEPIPVPIEALYTGENRLNSGYFGTQIRNLRDSLVLSNVLDYQIVSMEFGSWDTHKTQKNNIEPKLNDLFGTNRGLDTLYQELPSNVSDKLVFVIAGEFGRQLKANGGAGTDHGKGNSMLIIGNEINGTASNKSSAVYGDMFPLEELNRLSHSSPDIRGLTEIDHVLGAVCDGIIANSGNTVFPNRSLRALESGVDFSTLFG